jgi:UPF0755 protein
MKKRGITLALIAFGLLAGAVWVFAVRAPQRFAEPRIVSIRRGESFIEVARALAQAGVVRSEIALIAYGKVSREAARVKPGDYVFPGGESLSRLLNRLVRGDSMGVVITIPEGMTAHQIGERLARAGLVCGSAFDAAVSDGPITEALGLGPLGAEGFLFPATYRFSPRAKVDEILAAMLSRFYAALTPRVQARMFDLGLDARQLVTLASIIEKEAKMPGERPLIASVFYNRLAVGMPLQSDPTAQYNFAGETERAVRAVRTASAFNTYLIAGLPPGPIANPGLPSIEAALYPAHTDYLYFVARNDGTHVFSRTFQEHQRAIDEMRRTAARGVAPGWRAN